jgi:6-phosphogluconolactonase
MQSRFSILALLLLVPSVWANDCFVYFGTFTDTTSKGIYVSRLDMGSGKLSAPDLAAAVASPSYLAVSPDGRFLYAGARESDIMKGGAVDSYAIDGQTGHLKLLDTKTCRGGGPCYVGTDASDQALLVADYGSGTVESFHINPDGTLVAASVIHHHGKGVNPVRQIGPHAHSLASAPGNRFALACDLGLDKVMVYRLDPATASLTLNDPPFATVAPGSGARHVAFSPDGKTASIISEMACTVTVFDWDGDKGTLHERQTVSLLPPGLYTNTFTAAEIAYRPDGRFIYATIRGGTEPGANTISVLAVDRQTGNLSLIQNLSCDGNFPRGMGVDSSGHWLIVGNQKSGTVTVFKIAAHSGKLKPTGQVLNVGSAVDVKFAPAR